MVVDRSSWWYPLILIDFLCVILLISRECVCVSASYALLFAIYFFFLCYFRSMNMCLCGQHKLFYLHISRIYLPSAAAILSEKILKWFRMIFALLILFLTFSLSLTYTSRRFSFSSIFPPFSMHFHQNVVFYWAQFSSTYYSKCYKYRNDWNEWYCLSRFTFWHLEKLNNQINERNNIEAYHSDLGQWSRENQFESKKKYVLRVQHIDVCRTKILIHFTRTHDLYRVQFQHTLSASFFAFDSSIVLSGFSSLSLSFTLYFSLSHSFFKHGEAV